MICGFALYRVARRRRRREAWLAWIPVAGQWLLGSLSDQVQAAVRGKPCCRRRWLPALCGVAVGLLAVSAAGSALAGAGVQAMCCTLAELFLAAWLVLRLMCLYDVYDSWNTGTSVAYTLWTGVLPVLAPVFLLVSLGRSPAPPPAQNQNPPAFRE